MDWLLVLFLVVGGLLFLVLWGVPVAFGFFTVSLLASILVLDIDTGPRQVVLNTPPKIALFSLVPVPLFIFMGELLFHSGLASRGLNAMSKWMGRVPGRLGVLSMGGGAFFGVMSGSALANTSLLGTLLLPEMREKGYSKSLSAGSVMGAGPLALMLPPSALAVLLGTIGQIPVGPLLLAATVPGLLLALLNVIYIITRAKLDPSQAPSYDLEVASWGEKFTALFRDILPLLSIFLIVMGSIVLGIATPTEAAALGALASVLLIVVYGEFRVSRFVKAMAGTVRISGMILLIMAAASGYAAMLAFTGATRELLAVISSADVAPIMIIVFMILVVILLGAPLEQVSLMLITLPIFVPVVDELGFNIVWFGVLMLLTLDIAGLTPPLGLTLFVLKGVAPEDFTMGDVMRAGVPFALIDVLLIFMLFIYTPIALWLPSVFL